MGSSGIVAGRINKKDVELKDEWVMRDHQLKIGERWFCSGTRADQSPTLDDAAVRLSGCLIFCCPKNPLYLHHALWFHGRG